MGWQEKKGGRGKEGVWEQEGLGDFPTGVPSIVSSPHSWHSCVCERRKWRKPRLGAQGGERAIERQRRTEKDQ